MITHAMILAAGLGTRMRPLTNDLPKPLIPVAGKPLIDWCVEWLEAGGVTQIVVNSSYRAAQLEAHLASHPHIHVSREGEPPLETGGGVAKALPMLGKNPFLTMNSDAILVGGDSLAQLNGAWSDENDFEMLLVPRARAIGWRGNGDFILDAGCIRRPNAGEEADYVFTGVQVIHPRVFAGCPEGAFSLSALWNRSRGPEGWYQRIHAIVHEGDWLNVGDLEGLKTAEAYYSPAGPRT
jgi:MurNAc alpha-1-phosphate uridylyltransferase